MAWPSFSLQTFEFESAVLGNGNLQVRFDPPRAGNSDHALENGVCVRLCWVLEEPKGPKGPVLNKQNAGSRSETALFCGSFPRKGGVLAYVGRIHSLKDLKVSAEFLLHRTFMNLSCRISSLRQGGGRGDRSNSAPPRKSPPSSTTRVGSARAIAGKVGRFQEMCFHKSRSCTRT